MIPKYVDTKTMLNLCFNPSFFFHSDTLTDDISQSLVVKPTLVVSTYMYTASLIKSQLLGTKHKVSQKLNLLTSYILKQNYQARITSKVGQAITVRTV